MNKRIWAMAGALASTISPVSWAAPAKKPPVPMAASSKPRYNVDESNRASLLKLVASVGRVTAPAKSAFETEEQYQSRARAAAQGAGEYDFYVDFKFSSLIGYSNPFSYIPEIHSFIVVLPMEGKSEQQFYLSSDGGAYEGQNAYGAKTAVIRKNATSLKVSTTGRFIANMIRLPSTNGRTTYNPRSCYSMPADFSDCREVVRYPVEPTVAQSIANDLIARIHYKVQLSPDSLKVDYVHVPAKFNSPLEIDATNYELKNARVDKVSFFRASSGEVLFEGAQEPVTPEMQAFGEAMRYEKPLNDGSPKIRGSKFSSITFEIENTLDPDFNCTHPEFSWSGCVVRGTVVKKSECTAKDNTKASCPPEVIADLSRFGMRLKYRARKPSDLMVLGYRGSIVP